MAWLEIVLNTTQTDIAEAAAALTAAGFSDLVLEDQEQIEDFLEENRACWDYIDEELQQKLRGLSQIKLYLEDAQARELERLRKLAGELSLPVEVKPLVEDNWEESWKENYPPVPIGEKMVILPWWLTDSYEGDRLQVILDPGLTFGTGEHPTTRMVIGAMETLVKPGAVCLDLGSGSGILSIAALRLGAEHAVGVDIDPKAEDMARENAAYNGIGPDRFTALTGNVTSDRPLMARLGQREYDFVFVNIVADVIISLAPTLPGFLTESSTLICSGILDSRLTDVTSALTKAGLSILEIRADEDWRCIIAKRRMI